MKMTKDAKLDVGYVQLRRGKVFQTIELRRGILLDLDRNGEVLGIELLSLQKMAPHFLLKHQPAQKLKRAA